jgi:hypothetical protein
MPFTGSNAPIPVLMTLHIVAEIRGETFLEVYLVVGDILLIHAVFQRMRIQAIV